MEQNVGGEVRFISKLGSDLYLGMSEAGNNLVLRKGDQGSKTLFQLIPVVTDQPRPDISINEPVVTSHNNSLTTFRVIDKEGLAIMEYQYTDIEAENNFSTECSLPEWLPSITC